MLKLVTENLSKIYGEGETEVRAVDGMNLEIAEGEFLSIVGPSGSGKSTLLNLLGCLDLPGSGHVYIDGIDTSTLSITELARIRRKKVGFVFQEFNLLPVLNAVENVELPLQYLGVHKKDRRKMAMEALEKVDLVKRAKNRSNKLSGGEKQRVAIARALVTGPALVLADEPTGELDTANTCRILEIMSDLNRETGQTIVIVTHDPVVAEYTRRIVTLRDGKISSDRKSQSPETCRFDETV
ncbi:MAG: ABC transporter ATP-binding protein [Actinobacteria bacterium]|nr:ABC transporter ATP-binding protein [Actinomycetota bacterium]